MATLLELYELKDTISLRQKIQAACTIIAEEIRVEDPVTPNHTNRLIWALDIFVNHGRQIRGMMHCILAQKENQSVENILALGDNAIKNAVRASVDLFANGIA